MTPRRLAVGLLASAGVAVGHVVAYALAHPTASGRAAALGGHGYFSPLATLVVPVGLIVALGFAISTARSLGLRGALSWRSLALVQVVLFVVQEVGERSVAGDGLGAAGAERAVWIGLIVQVVLAFLIVRAVDTVARLVRRCRGAARRTAAIVRRRLVAPVQPTPRPRPQGGVLGSRGPPVGMGT